MNTSNEKWVAPKENTLPDFIICGAMKCGTSSIHQILSQHPEVFIPDGEIGFFDIDNILQHNDFSFKKDNKWYFQNMEETPQLLWDWYEKWYEKKGNSSIIGEDSTTYLASPKAAKRIAAQKKDIKIIIMLRNPTKRTYSQYWHMFRTGRATLNFEDTLLYSPYDILNRSLYLEQIQNFYNYIPKNRIKVILFEDFISNKEKIMEELCQFIGADYNLLPKNAMEIHSNPSRLPRFHNLQLLLNKKMMHTTKRRYMNILPNTPSKKNENFITGVETKPNGGLLKKIYKTINPNIVGKPPVMNGETEEFLNQYFKKELIGLNELLEKDVLSVWFQKNK